jgi:RNA polymerase subunit RPABC4/transcription elongation factor Spt4
MPFQEYHDFTIEAGDVETDENDKRSFAVRVFDSPAGQGEQEERITIPADLDQLCSSLARRELDEDIDLQIEIGMKLAGLLLPEYARGIYQRSLDLVTQQNAGLRLRLHLDDALTDYPWEFAYIQKSRGEHLDTDFLALDPRLSIVRHERLAQPVPGDWAQPPRKRRIVVAMASPEGDGWKKLPSLVDEQRALKAELDGATGLEAEYLPRVYGDISPDEMDSTTVEGLAAALMDRTDVFHFSGHGEFPKRPGPEFDKLVGQGFIILATEDNRPEPLPAAELAKMLAIKGVRLAVLGACEGAQTGYRVKSHIWGGVAVSLLREGIPAVVAMQYVVNDKLTATFMGAFYRALMAGYLVDEAVALGRAAIRREARLHLKRPHMRDWGVPVLYNRAPDGRVFHPVSDDEGRAQAEAEQYLGGLEKQEARVVSETGVMIGPINTTSARVEQKVRETLHGLMIGPIWYDHPPSRREILQKVDVVGERAAMVGTIEGDPKKALGIIEEVRAMAERSAARRSQPAARTTTSPPAGEESPQPSPTSSEGPICPECGRSVEEDWNVCPFCQADLRLQPACPSCGSTVEPDWAVCPYCKTSLQ